MLRSKKCEYCHAFTLIELLIVIGILAVLASVVVLVVNPVELLRRGRDAERLQELDSLSRALSLYETDRGSSGMGSTTVVYVSVPDVSPTCANLGLPSLPLGWSYGCAAEGNLHQVDGTGWVPVDFTSISYGAPLGILPVDPVNATSSGTYYTYVTGGSFELTATMEANKNQAQGNDDKVTTDGGTSVGAYETGSNLSLTPTGIEEFGRDDALVGYWTFDEGSGTTAGDSSGKGNDGSLVNSPVWRTGLDCKVQGCLEFASSTLSRIDILDSDSLDSVFGDDNRVFTITAWVYPTAWENWATVINKATAGSWSNTTVGLWAYTGGFACVAGSNVNSNPPSSSAIVNNDPGLNQWHHVACLGDSETLKILINGLQKNEKSTASLIDTSTNDAAATIGRRCTLSGCTPTFTGKIDELRVYDRKLSTDEIQVIYDATR